MALYIYPPTPVSVVVPPVAFIYDGAATDVEQDTTNPANNKPLPTGVYFIKDGIPTPVLEDTVTPANNEPLPVKLTGVTGDVIINAGDLNVSTSATNDSMAIGDGVTGQLAVVALNNDAITYALKVKDNDANTVLGNINLDTLALSATTGLAGGFIANDGISVHGSDGTLNTKLKTNAAGQLEIVGISSALPTGASTLAEQQTQTTRLTSIRDAVELLDNVVGTDGAAKPAGVAVVGGVDGSANAQELRTDTDGHLQVDVLSNVLPTGAATEVTLAALNAKVVNDFGAASSAVRVAAQIGNSAGGADFAAGSDGAQTLRVSANLKRSGNELSYNNNIPDANTLRVSAQIAVNGLVPDIGTGTAGPNTLRTVAILHDNDGDPIPFNNVLAASQWEQLFNTQSVPTTGVMLGWDGASHREVRLSSFATGNRLLVAQDTRVMSAQNNFTAAGDITPPAGAKGFIVQNSARSGGGIRFAAGAGVASASVGYLLEGGQSTSYIDGAPSVLSIANLDAATLDGCVVWFT